MRRLGLLVVTMTLTACPGSLENPERFLDGGLDGGSDAGFTCTPANVESLIFIPSCGGAGCHGPTNPSNGLDLQSPGVASRLKGVSQCMSKSEASFMLEKLHPSPACGSQMPLGRTLPDEQIACVASYLASLDGGVDGGP
jgi:hypothetical protein